ncbi:MAG: cation:proton antiporter, partial [Pyrinomonadaceae bacterium]|nr:cation:proton antiporter [Phycisphaerales bacterium]
MFISLLIANAEHESRLVVDLLAILAAAAIVAMLLSRLRFAAIPAYIITGAIIGPYAARLVTDTANIQDISQLAILLLMFTIGLHLNSSGLRMEAARVAALGIGSTLAVGLFLWPVCLLLGISVPAALAVSMAMAMSSTAVVLRILQQRREMHSMHGRICVALAISQDLISLVVLATLPLLAAWAGSPAAEGMIKQATSDPEIPKLAARLISAAQGIGGIAVLVILGKVLLPRLLKEAAKDASSETLLVLSAA